MWEWGDFMKRQNLRKAIIIISFLLFPVTLYYFSPYLIIQGAYEGVITGSFIIFSLLFIASLFLGRAFCGWFCPAGGLQECMQLVTNKKARGGKLNLIKYFIWVPWISSIIILLVSAGGRREIDFFYQTTNGISVVNIMAYVIYYGVVFLVVIMSFMAGKRAFCHYLCWMAPFMVIGIKLRTFVKIPGLYLNANSSICIGCGQCTKKCPMSLEVQEMVRKKCMCSTECILCGECSDCCPKSVIKLEFSNAK